MTFTRLRLPDWVAFVAALALILVMAMTWYTTKTGEQLRRDARLALPAGQVKGEVFDVKKQDEQAAAKFEKNAWHDKALIGRLILLALLASAAAAVIAGFARAAGHRFKGRLTPSAIASFAGLAAVVMLAYRILQPPGPNSGAVVRTSSAAFIVW